MSHGSQISRRRMLQISAVACASSLLSSAGYAATDSPKPVVWRGIALGAPAEIRLYSTDAEDAEVILRRAVDEMRRLENVFSLYQRDSALSRLNRDGALDMPPLDLIRLVSTAKTVSASTNGAFDPTIQPLWELYAKHFTRHPGPGHGPAKQEIADALALVDWSAVTLASERISFAQRDMRLSLNGIAQGYITDRVAALLRREGLSHVLVDMGETRGLGAHPSGRPWRVGIAAPGGKAEIIREIEMIDRAVATSAPLGTKFEPSGTFHHLLDPRTGHCASLYQSMTVTAPSATLADAFSTAFAVMAWADVRRIVSKMPELRVDALDAQGAWLEAHG